MSHLRNLFYHSPEQGHDHPPLTLLQTPVPTSVPVQVADRTSLTDIATQEACIEPSDRIVFHTDPRSAAADRFRFLRMRLREFRNTGKLKSLLITSPLSKDGKSTVILNLATALSERGKHTVLVLEADMHRPSLTDKLNLAPWNGLAECLQRDLSPQSVIRRIEPLGWYLLPAGPPRTNPTELLQKPTLGGIVQNLSVSFDWILIDAPPVVSLTDALLLQQHTDATLLVVKAGQTPRDAIDQTVKLLGQKRILGIVLNGVDHLNRAAYAYRYQT